MNDNNSDHEIQQGAKRVKRTLEDTPQQEEPVKSAQDQEEAEAQYESGSEEGYVPGKLNKE